jgi:hypothetical protein
VSIALSFLIGIASSVFTVLYNICFGCVKGNLSHARRTLKVCMHCQRKSLSILARTGQPASLQVRIATTATRNSKIGS